MPLLCASDPLPVVIGTGSTTIITLISIPQANLADFSDNQWVTCFQESAEALLGCSADTLGRLRDTVRQRVDCSFVGAESLCAIGFTFTHAGCHFDSCLCVCVCVPKDEDAFNEVFLRASYTTHIFRNRVKLETYNVSPWLVLHWKKWKSECSSRWCLIGSNAHICRCRCCRHAHPWTTKLWATTYYCCAVAIIPNQMRAARPKAALIWL